MRGKGWYRFLGIVVLMTVSFVVRAERLEYEEGKPTGEPSRSHSIYRWFGQKHISIRGSLGGALTHWDSTADASYAFSDHGDGSYTVGIGGSFPLTSSWSVDGGYFYFPEAKYTQSGSGYHISQWLVYSAAKMHYLVMNNQLDFYLKAGVSARDVNYAANQSLYVRPMLSVGCDYPMAHRLSIGAEYLHFGAVGNDSVGNYIPAIDALMLSSAYAFSV